MTDEYFGNNFTHEQYDGLRIKYVDQKLSGIDPSLFDTKWWDYRSLHPMHATYLFADCYQRAVRAGLARRVDMFIAYSASAFGRQRAISDKTGKPLKRTIANIDFTDGSKTLITGLWRARQMADKYGIPYYTYTRSAVMYAEDMLWTYVPKPHQMYANTKRMDINGEPIETMMESVLKRWEARKRSGVVLSSDKQFQVDSFQSEPNQIKYLQYVFEQIRRSRIPHVVAAELAFEKGVIKPEWLKRESESLYRQAKLFHCSTQGEDL